MCRGFVNSCMSPCLSVVAYEPVITKSKLFLPVINYYCLMRNQIMVCYIWIQGRKDRPTKYFHSTLFLEMYKMNINIHIYTRYIIHSSSHLACAQPVRCLLARGLSSSRSPVPVMDCPPGSGWTKSNANHKILEKLSCFRFVSSSCVMNSLSANMPT